MPKQPLCDECGNNLVRRVGFWCALCLAKSRAEGVEKLYPEFSGTNGPELCLKEFKHMGLMTYKYQIETAGLHSPQARQAASQSNVGAIERLATGEPSIFFVAITPGGSSCLAGYAPNVLLVGTIRVSDSQRFILCFDLVGPDATKDTIQNFGDILSFGLGGGEMHAMMQGDGTQSTELLMKLQEAARADPMMAQPETQALYRIVEETNAAIRLDIKQLYVWQILCKNPEKLHAEDQVLDEVWDVLSDEERENLLRRNTAKDGAYTYGCKIEK